MRLPFRRVASEFERAGGQEFRSLGAQVERNFYEIEKILTQVGFAWESASETDRSLDTTERFWAPVTVTVPAWAAEAHVLAWSSFQMTNNSGAQQEQVQSVNIAGAFVPGTGQVNSVSIVHVGNETRFAYRKLTRAAASLTDTFVVNTMARVGAGTNALNILRTQVFVVFTRLPEG